MPDMTFAEQVQTYLRMAGYSQQNLADELGLHPVVLSRKLRGNRKAHVTLLEIKRILTTLVQWRAIMTRAEAIHLLELAEVSENLFSAEEWQAPPLSLLEVEQPQQVQPASSIMRVPLRPMLHLLPAAVNPLIGRAWEMRQLHRLLEEHTVRLLTLLGPGGSGKTRLAFQLAHETKTLFPDGSWFVSLSAVSDADLVPMSILQALGITPPPHRSTMECLIQALREKRALLVLDNFEQLLSASELVGALLAAAPLLKVVLTSRIAVRLYGEHEFFVSPLDVPDRWDVPAFSHLERYGAIQLFVERVRAILPDFTLSESNGASVAQICALVDGLPLALELAAARMRSLSAAQLLTCLKSGILPVLTRGAKNTPDRHQTLRKTIAWSYELLTAKEQAHFRRLSVFVGGWTLQAAAAVCSGSEDVFSLELDALETMDSLIEKSLVYRQDIGKPSEAGVGMSGNKEPRFGMLETLREYALEQLEASGEREMRERAHADYFLALAEQTEPRLADAELGEWMDLLEQEYGNLQAALVWLHTHAENDHALRMAASLWPFWDQRGYYVEGRRWLEKLLEGRSEMGQLTGERSPFSRKVQAKVLIGASGLAWDQQDLERAAVLAEEALTIVRAEGYLHWTADVLADLGLVALDRGRLDEAVTFLTECLELTQQIQDEGRLATAQLTLSVVRLSQGELEQAETLAAEALILQEHYGNKKEQILSLHVLAGVSISRRDLARARSQTREALLVVRECGYVLGLAIGLVGLACIAALEGQGELAARLFGAEEAQRGRAEGRLPTAIQSMVDQVVQPMRTALGEEVWVRAYTLGQTYSLEEALEEALALTAIPGAEEKERIG